MKDSEKMNWHTFLMQERRYLIRCGIDPVTFQLKYDSTVGKVFIVNDTSVLGMNLPFPIEEFFEKPL